MPITILKNSTNKFTLPLVDNEGNSYTPQPGSTTLVNNNPELGIITFDKNTLTGTVTSLAVNGVLSYSFNCLTLKGKAVSGSDTVVIADTVPVADANQMVALYTE